MRTINEVVSQTLVWVQVGGLPQTFELRAADDDVVARLQFEGRKVANAETAWQKWTFQHDGVFNQRLTVHSRESGETAVSKLAWRGGCTLELSQGREVHFGPVNFWRTRWDWSATATEASFMQVRLSTRLMKIGGQVEIEMAALAYPELPLLVVLGWYLLALGVRRSGAAVAVR